jgi:hypothetical protein
MSACITQSISFSLVELSSNHFAFELIQNMIANHPTKRPTISEVCASLQEIVNEDITVYPSEDELHSGQLSVVYKKQFRGKFVSVKKTSTADEEKVFDLDHCNVLKFIGCIREEEIR